MLALLENKSTFESRFYWLLYFVAAILILFSCKNDTARKSLSTPEVETQGWVSIAAFNIQAFGKSKMTKEGVPGILAKIIARYDLILVQEIRDSSQTAIYQLLNLVNQENQGTYQLLLSARLGRTRSKEQYAYFYKPESLKLLSSYHYDDGPEPDNDEFQREPFIAWFETISGNSSFSLVGIHTSPSDAVSEIDGLVDVYDDMAERWDEFDALILGDFNADCGSVGQNDRAMIRLFQDLRFSWWIDDEQDTTTSSTDCAYDRIVSTGALTTSIIPDSVAVFRFDLEYELNPESVKTVSDHYPVEIKIRL